MKRVIIPVAVLLLAGAGLFLAARGPSVPTPTSTAQPDPGLPSVGSAEKLKALLAQVQDSPLAYGTQMRGGMGKGLASQAAPQTGQAHQGAAQGADYSQTNVQVAGVDEADVVKTDGKYLYQVNKQRVIIVQAYPAQAMKVVDTLDFNQADFQPRDLYVDSRYLVVIGNASSPGPYYGDMTQVSPRGGAVESLYPVYTGSVKAIIYDIADKAGIKKLREVELQGRYVTSRKIGSSLYLVANQYLDVYRIMQQGAEPQNPSFRDSALGGSAVGIDYKDIRYFPDFTQPNYLLVAGVDLDRSAKGMQVAAYLGAGQNVYASTDNLYVALTHYEQPNSKAPSPAIIPAVPAKTTTQLYKFALEPGGTAFKAKGEVPGTVLNQYSMDEFKGHFRLATTTGDVMRTDEYTAKNNIYVLDSSLKLSGRLENIAPGERIYSTRFMGDRAYMVTFKKVDPFFVIDMKDPEAPKITGALKIPGYSDYLLPYDANHIIGFGKDTVEATPNYGPGNKPQNTAFYQGLKIALFDVSNVAEPVEQFKTVIGDRGTESEILHNPKALLFDKEKNLLAFPVTVAEIKGKQPSFKGFPPYGEFVFQGAYVYHLDLSSGFSLAGRITHVSDAAYRSAGRDWYGSGRNVERIVYIGDTLYTLSQAEVKANELSNLKEISSLALPG